MVDRFKRAFSRVVLRFTKRKKDKAKHLTSVPAIVENGVSLSSPGDVEGGTSLALNFEPSTLSLEFLHSLISHCVPLDNVVTEVKSTLFLNEPLEAFSKLGCSSLSLNRDYFKSIYLSFMKHCEVNLSRDLVLDITPTDLQAPQTIDLTTFAHGCCDLFQMRPKNIFNYLRDQFMSIVIPFEVNF